MQLRHSQTKGGRPACPVDPAHRVHGNGRYQRLKSPDGNEMISVPCWNCTGCSLSFSVLPDGVLPYRAISTEQLESELDSAFCGKDSPQQTENEKGCLKRALHSFIQNTPSLADALGQIIKTIHPSAAQLWKELRELAGTLRKILLYLADPFKVSLLGMYQCLRF